MLRPQVDRWMDSRTHTMPPPLHQQGNHYQYDSLRRAKHSSMMCLYHLLNPEAPKFLPACVLCLKDITSAYKWACQERGCEDDFAICNVSWRARLVGRQRLVGG